MAAHFDRVLLIDSWTIILTVSPKSDLQRLQKLVHSQEKSRGPVCYGFHRRGTLKHYDPVSKIRGHYEIVLHYECSLLGMKDKPEEKREGGEGRGNERFISKMCVCVRERGGEGEGGRERGKGEGRREREGRERERISTS